MSGGPRWCEDLRGFSDKGVEINVTGDHNWPKLGADSANSAAASRAGSRLGVIRNNADSGARNLGPDYSWLSMPLR